MDQFIPKNIEREKVAVGYLAGSCLDDQTEILTENGWKLFENLEKETEKVVTLNPETNEIEYHLPKRYIKEKYNGKLHYIENKNVCYAVTPNHNMYASIHKPGLNNNMSHKKLNLQLIKSENLFGKYFHCKKDAIWKGEEKEYFVLPKIEYIMSNGNSSRIIVCEERKFKMDDWLKFFGFWLAEGWISKTKNLYQVGVSQKKDNDYLNIMKKIFKEFGFNPLYSNDKIQLRVINKQLWAYLKQFGGAKEKYIPKEILKLSTRQLNILLDWYIKGDGNTSRGDQYKNKFQRKHAWTVSKKLADDLMEISLKTEIAASIKNRGKRNSRMSDGREISATTDCYTISFYSHPLDSKKNKLTPPIRPEHQKEIKYSGYVYCVEVDNHLIYVRRKNSKNTEMGLWVGNSHLIDVEEIRGLFQRLRVDDTLKNKFQVALCGFDLRGTHTDVDTRTGEKRTRNIEPKETSWYQYERIFTDDYRMIEDKKYLDFLMKFKREDYPNEENMIYRRVWTKLLKKYATNYNLMDISLAPLSLKGKEFNLAKSQLKLIESSFHKKAVICTSYAPKIGPYDIDGRHEKNCILIPERKNHKDWFKYAKKLIESKNMREDLGNQLYEDFHIKYHIDTDSKLRREFYLSILK